MDRYVCVCVYVNMGRRSHMAHEHLLHSSVNFCVAGCLWVGVCVLSEMSGFADAGMCGNLAKCIQSFILVFIWNECCV